MSGLRCTAWWFGLRCPSPAGMYAIGRGGPFCNECFERLAPVALRAELCQAQHRGMSERNAATDIADLEARVAKMRSLGVVKWGDIELGPEPSPESDETQRTATPDEAMKMARAERQRVAFAASGGTVKSAGRT